MTEVVERDKFQEFNDHVFEFIRMNKHINNIIFYGELFGKGIQNRINYNLPDGKDIRFYDATINGEYCTQKDFFKLMNFIYAKNLTVPVVAKGSFDEMMDIDVENLISVYNPDGENNFDEGVVIKPWNTIVTHKDEQVLFHIKKKSDRFADKMKCKKVKVVKDVDPKLQNMINIFTMYLTENRLLDVFGKEGEIETPSDMGKYIKLMSTDARDDFLKDHKTQFTTELDDKQKKQVFGVAGKVVAKMLQKYL